MMRMQRSPATMSSLWLLLQCALATEALVLLPAKLKSLNAILLDIVRNETTHLAFLGHCRRANSRHLNHALLGLGQMLSAPVC